VQPRDPFEESAVPRFNVPRFNVPRFNVPRFNGLSFISTTLHANNEKKKTMKKKRECSWPDKYFLYSTHESWKYCVSSGTVANAIFS